MKVGFARCNNLAAPRELPLRRILFRRAAGGIEILAGDAEQGKKQPRAQPLPNRAQKSAIRSLTLRERSPLECKQTLAPFRARLSKGSW